MSRAARPRDKSYKITDTNRLHLLITPSGGKLWRWNYYYDGRQKSLAFGAYPLISLADARVEGAYNRTLYMPRRRELAHIWADMPSAGLPNSRARSARSSGSGIAGRGEKA